MLDYLSSRNLEVQQRAFDYKVMRDTTLKENKNCRDYIFKTPLTESQVSQD